MDNSKSISVSLKAGAGDRSDVHSSLSELVLELRRSRQRSDSAEGWASVFTIVDRIMFLVTLIISIVLMFCLA